jgi:uncharacterized protein YhdP
MGKNKNTRTNIAGLQLQIDLHEQKITDEKRRANPDLGLIKHWEKEIRGWQARSIRLKRRLPQRRK